MHYLNKEQKSQKETLYTQEAKLMRDEVTRLIVAKQKSTMAMALSLGNDKQLATDILEKKVHSRYYTKLIENFRKETQFKNIWIQIVDVNLNSIFRSWAPQSGDSLKNVRPDLLEVIKSQKPACAISSGRYDLTLKAMVPIFYKGEILGALEVISHFNSISKEMSKSGVDSVVILNEEHNQKLKYPFTKIFIGRLYVANFDAPRYLQNYLSERGVEKYFGVETLLESGYLVTSLALKTKSGETIGHYIMFKDIEKISMKDLDFFVFKWVLLSILSLMALLGLVNMLMYYSMRKQKIYYKNIINSSTNIVAVNSKTELIEVNKAFFDYFYQYSTLEEYKREHLCLCDFFVEEEGYLAKEVDGVEWREYIHQNHHKNHKVKIKYLDNIYYFVVNASKISEEEDHYSVVFSDITNEEIYKNELEHLSVTDSLTGIKNRHYFDSKIQEEIIRANRYEYSFSIIMFDIDHFKSINDTYGHQVGDEVLVEYSMLVLNMLRESDVFCRVGGEEFVMILPYTEINEAKKIAQKIRVAVQEYKKIVPITISGGVAQYRKEDDYETIYKRVDAALYEAKESGRNRVVVES